MRAWGRVGEFGFPQFVDFAVPQDDEVNLSLFLVTKVTEFVAVPRVFLLELDSLQEMRRHEILKPRSFVAQDICVVEEEYFGGLANCSAQLGGVGRHNEAEKDALKDIQITSYRAWRKFQIARAMRHHNRRACSLLE